MVKVSVSSVGTQASTVAISMFSRISALNDAITKLSSFAEAATLQGTAYSNAKSYATGTLTPMLQGMILFSETLSEKCTELQTLYVSICGDEDLDSVVLESKLASDRASLKIAEALLEHLNDDPEPSKSAISSTKSNIKKLKKRIKSNQKKLDNLNEFNAHSATVFADISNAQSTVNQALAAVSTGFSGYNSKTGAFGKPTSGQMEWTKTVKKNWKEREDAKAEELKSKKAEESKKASKIENTTKKSNVSVDKKKLIKAANEAYKLGEIKKDTYESIISCLSNASAALLKEVAKSKLTDTAVLGAAIDFGAAQVKGGEDVEDATMKTGAPVIIGSAAKVVGTAAGTATAGLLISTGVLAPPAPVVGSAVDFGATAVIGVGGSMVFDYVYDNKDEINHIIKRASKDTINNVSDFFELMYDSTGSIN